jgi:cytochrome d ubiquinol oxidase subunit II
VAQYPYIVVPDLTLGNTATAPSTLRLLTWALGAGAVVLFPSFGYLFFVFKTRERPRRAVGQG